jgi:Mlc titration factor MtfA (ptsG expression regulator)
MNSSSVITVMLFAVIAILILLFFYVPAWRDRRIRNKPFPKHWLSILSGNLPAYSFLSSAEQDRLQQLIKLFIAKKNFVGCGGLEINDEIKVTIASEACLLLLHHSWSVYPKLYSVLVYPSAFIAAREERQADGTVSFAEHNLSGESWSNGRVILSWDDVVSGVSNFSDGRNVVLHEFAHQLDSESGSTNGAPILRRNSYGSWATVLSKEFEGLRWDSMHHHKNTMDEYGATNPAEFFAVATETFFEKPLQLHRKHQKLYEELVQYYQTDPRQWYKK